MATFAPACMFYDALKFTGRLWIAPVDWTLRKFNPNYVNDVTNKKDQIASHLKQKADKSIFTMSSFIAK